MLIPSAILIVSLVILYFGAEFVLDSAEKIGIYFGLSHLVVGLLIVGFGTSLPELFVSHIASIQGLGDIAFGNVVGSNVANLFLIMGLTGLFTTLHITRKDIQHQFGYHLLLTIILAVILAQTEYFLTSSLVLIAFFFFYLFKTYQEMKKEEKAGHHSMMEPDRHSEEVVEAHQVRKEEEPEPLEFKDYIKLITGFVFLYIGGKYLVSSGNDLGVKLGISQYVLSAILIAFGTSFPELMTAILAMVKKKNVDLITGNIIGSNIFNVAFVMGGLGGYSLKFPKSGFIPELAALLFASVFLLLLSVLKKDFRKMAGVVFLVIYSGLVYYWIKISH